MDRGQLAYLQTKINERVYLMLCDPASPLQEVREAISEFLTEIDLIEQEMKKVQEEKNTEQEKADG